MRKQKIEFEITVYESLTDLSENDRQLMEKAIASRAKAYAPYSGFQVGAAVALINGEVVIGNNQENASYPSGLCAERVAIFQAGAKFPGITIESIAITAASKNHSVNHPVAPCGNCRQSMLEYEVRQTAPIRVLFMGENGEVFKCNAVGDMLPFGFDSSFL
ncbi:cytidine deaminase [Pareuzebyella sediminis]|uniref:cytidine deaminase n=1 Tax=Pareuzebyella sediminis TaxID=2607998 RepID=UPI0011ED34F1|nr:cytidine deaminase [Pareuzebyella sediminis]